MLKMPHLLSRLKPSLPWLFGTGCVVAVLILWATSQLTYSLQHNTPGHVAYMAMANPESVVLNPKQWLADSWLDYKTRFIEPDGRVKDFYSAGASTSEGQSYALLRATWMDDKPTFTAVWQWTRNNLQQKAGSKLFAWKWGKRKDGHWGMVEPTSASDADQDIALALLMGYQRWGEGWMVSEAQQILDDIWQREVTSSVLGPVLLPGDWYMTHTVVPEKVLINPSYLAPYAYHVFALFDKKHDWKAVAQSSYQVLKESLVLSDQRLMLDWIWLERSSGKVSLKLKTEDPYSQQSLFSYDAFRVYWRIYLDDLLFATNSEASRTILDKGTRSLKQWTTWHQQELPGPLTPQGQELESLKSKAVYGALWPVLSTQDVSLKEALAKQYHWQASIASDDYYAQNWNWFGMGLYVLANTVKDEGYQPNKDPYWALDTLTFWLKPKAPIAKK